MSITSPDDRISEYSPVVATTDFPAGFPVFDNDDLIVVHDGVERDDFAVSATYVEGISTNAKAVFAIGITGHVQVVGARAPHRTNRFGHGPLPPRDLNLALDTVTAEIQEVRRDIERALLAPYGETVPDTGEVIDAAQAAVAAANSINQRIYSAVALPQADTIPAIVKRLYTQFRAPNYLSPATLSGGANYRRISLVDLAGYPVQSYFRSLDRFIPDGTVSATNGGYWLIDEPEINVDMLGAVGDAVVDDATAIQAALNLAGLVKGKVLAKGKTYIIASTILIPAGVALDGKSVGKIKQKAGANLYSLIFLNNGSVLSGIGVDADEGNNPLTVVAVHIANSNDCEVSRCVIENSAGNGIVINNGERAAIRGNIIRNFHDHAIVAYGSNGKKEHDIRQNTITRIGWAAIVLQQADYSIVESNSATGQIVGDHGGRMYVNVTGDQVTWVSGPNFTGIRSGNFLVYDSGREIRVKSMQSNTSLTLETAAPVNMSNVQAMLGSGDLIALVGSSFCDVKGNKVERTSTFGMGASLSTANVQCGNNRFAGNRIERTGKNGINISGAGAGLNGYIENTSIFDNDLFNVGCGGGIGEPDKISIYISGQTGGNKRIARINIDGNTVTSHTGDGQSTYWLGTNGEIPYGSVALGSNRSMDVANGSKIWKDVLDVTLGTGWGASATWGTVESFGHHVRFIITAAGSVSGAADFTILKATDTFEQPAMLAAEITSGSQVLDIYGEQQTTLPGQWRATFSGTPVAGQAFQIGIAA
jgi:hypothetical protein